MMRIRSAKAVLLLLVVTALAVGSAETGAMKPTTLKYYQPLERTVWDSVYSGDQAVRGDSTYKRLCARCHAENLSGGDEAVELTGSAFVASWSGQTLADLHDRIRTTMPTDTPGVYNRQEIADVIAFMLRYNGFPAGTTPLTSESDALRGIRFLAGRP